MKTTCIKCGECCKTLTIPLTLLDINTIASHLNKTPEQFFKTHLKITDNPKAIILKEKPCPFLKDNICTINNIKPSTCKTTPCPKDKKTQEFIKTNGLTTLQYLNHTKEEMITHMIATEYTEDYLDINKEYDKDQFQHYLKKINEDLNNKILKDILTKKIIQLTIPLNYQKTVTENNH